MSIAVAEVSPFAVAHDDLSSLGYHPVPLIAATATHHRGAGKAPGRYQSGGWSGLTNWQGLRTIPLSGFPLQLAMKMPGSNVGICMGTPAGHAADGTPLFVMSVDIDTEDHDAFDDIVRGIPPSPMRVKGRKGWKAFYRAPATIRSRGYDDSRVPAGQGLPRRLVDVLTGFDTRQAVVSPSIHPDTGASYCWLQGPVRADELPIFSQDDHTRLVETLELHGYNPEAVRQGRGERKAYVPADHDADDVFDEVKAAALANIGAWIHDVPGLYALRPARGGYEAVNTLRDSSSGQPLERRKRNLSIQPSGIKDFGTGETWSAIDLVADFAGLSVAEALSFLEERLPGLGDDGSVVIDLNAMIASSGKGDCDLPAPLRGLSPAPERNAPPATSRMDATEGHEVLGGEETLADLVEGATHAPPTEMPAHLLDCPGLVGEIADWMSRTAQRPLPALNLITALAVVGTAGGRKFAGPTETGLAIMGLALAPTGAGKAHPIRAAQHLLNMAGLSRMIAPSSWMSGSALIQHLGRDPACVSFSDEVAEFFAKLNSSKASTHERAISGLMRELFGINWGTFVPPGWASSASRAPISPIHAPAYSFIGYSVPDAVWEALQGSDVTNGFLNRFLLVTTAADAPEQDPDESIYDLPETMVDRLRDLAGTGGPLATATSYADQPMTPLVRVPWADGKGGRAHTVFKELREHCRTHPAGEKLMKRTAEIAIRLATIRAVGRDGARAAVTAEDMFWARELALWSAERMIHDAAAFMSESEWQQKTLSVLRIIREAPGQTMTRTAIYRRVNHKFPPRDLDSILAALVDAAQIAPDNSTRAGQRGPKPTLYRAVQ